MKTAAIIIGGAAISMAASGFIPAAIFWAGIAVALWHRASTREPRRTTTADRGRHSKETE